MSQEWKQGLCGCLGDCGTCCCGYCCPCCLTYSNAESLGKSGILCCLLWCIFPCIPVFVLRGEARERYGIEGSTAGDAMVSCCCTPCVNCQTASEIKGRGDDN